MYMKIMHNTPKIPEIIRIIIGERKAGLNICTKIIEIAGTIRAPLIVANQSDFMICGQASAGLHTRTLKI